MRYQFPMSVPDSFAYRLQLSVFETEKQKCPTLKLKCVIMSNFASKNRYLSPKLSIAGWYRQCNQFARFTKITLIHIPNYGTYMRRDKRKKRKNSSRGVCFEQELLLSSILTFWMRSVFSSISHINLSLIHIWRCRRSTLCRSRWSPYH